MLDVLLCKRLTFLRQYRRSFFSWNERLSSGVSVINEEDKGLFALHKPFGKSCHPNIDANTKSPSVRVKTEKQKCIFHSAVYDFNQEVFMPAGKVHNDENVKDVPTPNFVWLLHRLDSATSGVLLVANNKEIAIAVKRALKQRVGVVKTYVALVVIGAKALLPKATNEFITWKDDITIDKSGSIVRAYNVASDPILKTARADIPKTAVTEVCVLANYSIKTSIAGYDSIKLALVQLRPLTGFTHQLRHQCATHGMPIVGDRNYGDFGFNKAFKTWRQNCTISNSVTAKAKASVQVCANDNAHASANASDCISQHPASESENAQLSSQLGLERLYLHAQKIDMSYQLNHNDQRVAYRFVAESPIPADFYVLP